MGTTHPPAYQIAKSRMVHSYRVRAMMATRSPIAIPAATRPLAVARISSSTCRAVSGCHPSPRGRDIVMRSGSNHARSEMRLVRFPAVAAGIMAGLVTSFMSLTLAGEMGKREDSRARLMEGGSRRRLVALRPCPRRAFPQSSLMHP